MNGAEEDKILTLTNVLLDARRDTRPIPSLPPELLPASLDEVYAVQSRVAAAFGPVGGWKVGAPSPDDAPLFCPMPAAWMAGSGAVLAGPRWQYRGIEAEIAFLVGQDLPRRSQPYTRDEVLDAMASCHPAIEVLETAFTDPAQVPREAMLADLQMHGGFVHGPAVPNWRTLDFKQTRVTLVVDSVVRAERTGSNTSGDLLRLLPWLANEGAARTGGLRRGQWITTGSWTGNTLVFQHSGVSAVFDGVGEVDLRFS